MKTKNLIFNIIMVAAIIAIVISGVLFVYSLKSGKPLMSFAEISDADSFGTITTTKGIVQIERKGIGYTLKPSTVIVKDDKLKTLNKSSIEMLISNNSKVMIDENSQLLSAASKDKKHYFLKSGNFFIQVNSDEKVLFTYENGTLTAADGVFTFTVHDGVPSVNAYYGTAEVTYKDSNKINLTQGNTAFIGSNGLISTSKFSADSMKDFDIKQAQKISDKPLCFTSAEFEKVLNNRADLVKKAMKAKEKRKNELLAQGKKEVVIGVNRKTAQPSINEEKPASSSEETMVEFNHSTSSETISSIESIRDIEPIESIDAIDNTSVMSATIEINCHTLLSNMDELTPGKEGYVPDDGVILNAVTVEFTKDETVFDVLKRVCDASGIQLEYSWFPIYNSHYIEGINHLYEFDGGDGSGWVYTVNGWRPNYGVSVYKLEDGDFISFDYTCDLGNDV